MKQQRERETPLVFPPTPLSSSILLKAIRLVFYSLLTLPFAFAVTYRVDPAGGPETLAAEVKEAFDAWVALSNKIEVSEAEENPEGVFQYGDSERFGSDTLSLTVQRQTNTRSILYLISPNAENRQRILLHETGIAIGLTPQIPGTPAPPATTPTESTPVESTPVESTPDEGEANQTSTEIQDDGTSETSTSETSTSETSTEQTTDSQSSENQASEETTETPAATETPETDTPALTENSVMNPSISPDDSVELGEVERRLVEELQLFVSEDINRDGAVNFYDLVAVAQAFGRSGVNDPADINKDGVIDQSDVDELQKVYTFSDPSETPPGGITSQEAAPAEGADDVPPSNTPDGDGTLNDSSD
jgi:hypothetical protein